MALVRKATTQVVLGTVLGSMVVMVGGKTIMLAERECPTPAEYCWPVGADLSQYQPGGTLANTIWAHPSSSS